MEDWCKLTYYFRRMGIWKTGVNLPNISDVLAMEDWCKLT